MPSGATSRASEPASAAPAAPVALDPDFEPGGAGNTVREVSFKLEGADGAAVHLKFTERRGEVHVVTRTQDAGLSRKLSGDLPELRKAIEDSGLSGDIWSAGQGVGAIVDAPPVAELVARMKKEYDAAAR